MSAAEAAVVEARLKQAAAEATLRDLTMKNARTAQTADLAAAQARRQAPRSLSAAEEKKLTTLLLGGSKGDISIDLPIAAGGEAEALAAVIEKCLLKAAWKVSNHAYIPFPAPAAGLYLVVRSSRTPPERAISLQRALKAVGLDAPGSENRGMEVNEVVLIVAKQRNHSDVAVSSSRASRPTITRQRKQHGGCAPARYTAYGVGY